MLKQPCLAVAFLAGCLAACDKDKSDSESCDSNKTSASLVDNGESTEGGCDAPVTVGGDVSFSGYIQRAFNLKVNGVDFADSEDFYTRFIPELIQSSDKYKETLKDADITVEGEYALDRFGSNAKVFMASQAQDGHLFEATTDLQGKFVAKVTASALDETFKARATVRIGLEIKLPDATEATHYCYILHSIRENISISENSKPVIFSDFNTELTTYNCTEFKESQLQIPVGSQTGEAGSSGGSGAISVTPKFSLPLTKDQTVRGMAADASNVYFLIGEGANWQIVKIPEGAIAPTPVCSFPDDGKIAGGLAWDGASFYVMADRFRGNFVKLDSACKVTASIATELSTTSNLYSHLAFDQGKVFWTRSGGKDDTNNVTAVLATSSVAATYAGEGLSDAVDAQTDWVCSVAAIGAPIAASAGLLYGAITDCGGASGKYTLWKIREDDGTPVGHVNLPTSDYSDLKQPRFMAASGAATLLIAAYGDDSRLHVYSVDVTSL